MHALCNFEFTPSFPNFQLPEIYSSLEPNFCSYSRIFIYKVSKMRAVAIGRPQNAPKSGTRCCTRLLYLVLAVSALLSLSAGESRFLIGFSLQLLLYSLLLH